MADACRGQFIVVPVGRHQALGSDALQRIVVDAPAELPDLVTVEGHPRGHSVATATDEAIADSVDGLGDVELLDRAGRTHRLSPLDAQHEGRSSVALSDGPRHQPRHSTMPLVAREDDHRVLLQDALVIGQSLVGLGKHVRLDALTVGVHVIQPARYAVGQLSGVGHEQFQGVASVAEPTCGVQARGYHEPHVIGVQGLLLKV